MKRLRVCVIGAGAAGLVAARHLTSQLNVFDVSVFEQASCIGGTWVYNENTGTDDRGLPIHSSIYRNLRTNLPKEVMAFPDFPFPQEWPSFMTHQQVLRYLEDYATKFELWKYIHFNSVVRSVRPLVTNTSPDPMWEVIVSDVDTKESKALHFEAVIVCNGHYFVPYEPVIPGLISFPGMVMHSHNYRHPEVFQGKRVVILGAAASGQDICLEVAKFADVVYLSHKNILSSELPLNVEQHYPISSVSSDCIVQFDGGQQRKVDVILLCTGYCFSFPFLDDECGIHVTNNRITQLYKHIFNIKYPTLSFIGLGLRVCPFPQFSLQAQYVVAVLSGQKHLPSKEEMKADEEREFQKILCNGLQEKHAHLLGTRQWDYNNTVAQLAGVDKLGSHYESIYRHTHNRRTNNLMDYKNDELKLNANGKWTIVK